VVTRVTVAWGHIGLGQKNDMFNPVALALAAHFPTTLQLSVRDGFLTLRSLVAVWRTPLPAAVIRFLHDFEINGRVTMDRGVRSHSHCFPFTFELRTDGRLPSNQD
jgi:hypothetical protein